MSSSAKVQSKFPGPEGDLLKDFWQTSPFSPRQAKQWHAGQVAPRLHTSDVKSALLGQSSTLPWRLPKASCTASEGVTVIWSCGMDKNSEKPIKNHSTAKEDTCLNRSNRLGAGHGTLTQKEKSHQQTQQCIIVWKWQSLPAGPTDWTTARADQHLCVCLYARAYMLSNCSCRQEQFGSVSD